MAHQKQQKLPKPTRISRKLSLSSERLVEMSDGDVKPAVKCTLAKTGCAIHTC